jgi:LAO/AO transport system kinase
MEIGDAFIVNKADREGAEQFAQNLKQLTQSKSIPVFKTVASKGKGVTEVINFVNTRKQLIDKKPFLLGQKAWQLIQQRRMADIDKKKLQQEITEASQKPGFNIYKFVEDKIRNS